MEDLRHIDGVAALKQHDLKVPTVVFMIYCLASAGAFGLEEMIPASGPGLTIIMLIAFMFLWAYPLCHLVAELGSILPAEGGPYVWAKEALGEFWGFQAGWWGTMAYYVTTGVYIALIVGYLGSFIELSTAAAISIKIGIILFFCFINLMGIQEVGRISTLFSVIILIAFGAVSIVGLLNWNYNPFVPFTPEDQGIVESVGGGISICLWMYCGYECISSVAGEIKNPQVIPKGVLIAMPLIAASYILPTMAGLASVGQWENWSTEGGGGNVGYVDVLTQFLGPVSGILFLVVAIVSQCSIFNAYLASGSRGFFVLADDHLSPGIMAKVSKKTGVPYVGIISLTVVSILLTQYDFTVLVMGEVLFNIALYLLLTVSVVVLRKKIPVGEREGKYVIPGGNLGLITTCGLLIAISAIALLISGTDYLMIGLLAISTGPLAYVFIKRRYGGLSLEDPVKYPLNPQTRLAAGDTARISLYCIIVGVFSMLGSFFLLWYEGDWGAEYYLEEYGKGLMSDFNAMISVLQYGGVIIIILGVALLFLSRKVETRSVEGRRQFPAS